MRPKQFYTKSNWDLFVYVVLFVLLTSYAFFIKGTCEELGCLAIIIPILAIMGMSIIEFFANIWVYSKEYHFSTERKIVFVISGIIAVFSLILILFSLVN